MRACIAYIAQSVEQSPHYGMRDGHGQFRADPTAKQVSGHVTHRTAAATAEARQGFKLQSQRKKFEWSETVSRELLTMTKSITCDEPVTVTRVKWLDFHFHARAVRIYRILRNYRPNLFIRNYI